MIDTVVVSGGNIQVDFALDFLKKLKKETNEKISAQTSTSHSKDSKDSKELQLPPGWLYHCLMMHCLMYCYLQKLHCL